MRGHYEEMVLRNIGVVSGSEQEKLRGSTIAIGGCGGMGGLSAELLVRMGIGHIRIADVDSFEVSNINRQFSAFQSTVGKRKVDVVRTFLLDINPGLGVESFSEGVTEENADDFVEGADLVIDGIDYNSFYSTVFLHRAARKEKLYVMTAHAIGFGANVFTFAPDQMTIEEYVGLPEDATKEEISNYAIPREKFCPILPPNVDSELVRKVVEKEKEIPNIGIAQAIGTGAMTAQAVLFLLGKQQPILAPDFIAIDLERYALITRKTNAPTS